MTDGSLPPPSPTAPAPALPLAEEADLPSGWQPLPARAATLAGWTSALSTLVPFLVFAVVCTLADPASPRLYLGVAVLAVVLVPLSGGLALRRTRRTQWQLDDNAFGVRRQRLWSSDTRVPRARVQHLDIQRGPLQRRAGLSTLVVHTAGSQLQALRLSGLDHADAERLRERLARPQDHDGL